MVKEADRPGAVHRKEEKQRKKREKEYKEEREGGRRKETLADSKV